VHQNLAKINDRNPNVNGVGTGWCARLDPIGIHYSSANTNFRVSTNARAWKFSTSKDALKSKVENIHHHKRFAIQENHVSAYESVLAIGRRWRQLAFKIDRDCMNSDP
jgi:hypothetical protein